MSVWSVWRRGKEGIRPLLGEFCLFYWVLRVIFPIKSNLLRWDGDSPRVLYEGQAVPRGVREPRDGEDGEDNRDLLLLQLLLLQQPGRTARWAITEIFQGRNFIFCSDWTSSTSRVLLTACLTITITLTRLLSTLWALTEHNKTTKQLGLPKNWDVRFWYFLAELLVTDVQLVHFYTKINRTVQTWLLILTFSHCVDFQHISDLRQKTEDRL